MNLQDFITQAKTNLTVFELQDLIGEMSDHLQELDRQKQLAARKYGRLVVDDLTGKTNYIAYDENGKIVHVWPKRGNYYAVIFWNVDRAIMAETITGCATEASLKKTLAKYSNSEPLICLAQ